MRLFFAGVRGSTPVSGRQFDRIGGHTSCVAVTRGDETNPRIVLDAGTGLINLAEKFGAAPFQGSILLTHLHWDHVQGLPFFRPADRQDARTTLMMPAQGDARTVLRQAMAPPNFPIGPEGLNGAWEFAALEAGTRSIEGFDVTALDIPHKGGRTFGYRVSDGRRSMAYIPDHGPHGPDAVELAVAAGAGRLVLTHHGPFRADDAVDEIGRAAEAAFGRELVVAREDLTLDV